MPLTTATLNNNLAWALTKTNSGGYNNTTQQDSINFNLNGLNLTTFNQVVSKQYTILTSASQDIDLTSLTNLVGEAVTFTHVLLISVQATGSTWTVGPGASNGFTYFWSGTTPANTMQDGGCVMLSGPVGGPGGTVDSSHKVITITNTGATTLTVDVTILGAA